MTILTNQKCIGFHLFLRNGFNFFDNNSDTPIGEIEDCFKRFIKRDDIDIILINQSYAELIRHVIDAHTSPLPAVLEIPSKDHPYDASKDSILRRAKVCVNCVFIIFLQFSHIFIQAIDILINSQNCLFSGHV